MRLLPLLLLLAGAAASPQTAAVPGPAQAAPQEPTAVQDPTGELARTQRLLDELPSDAAEGSPEAQLRAVAERRLALVQELAAARDALAAAQESIDRAADDEAAERARLEELLALPAPEPPAEVDVVGLEGLREEVRSAAQELAARRQEQEAAERRIEDLPARIQEVRERRAAAKVRESDLIVELAAATQPAERERLELRIANARLEEQVARELEELLESQRRADRAAGEGLRIAAEVARARAERLEARVELYQRALEESLGEQRRTLEQELTTRERELEQGGSELERLRSRREALVAMAKLAVGELEPFKLRLSQAIQDREKRLEIDREELRGLREQVLRYGTGGRTADQIQRTYARLPERRRLLEQGLPPEVVGQLEVCRDRRFEIDDVLHDLSERWSAELGVLLAELDEAEWSSVREEMSELREAYRAALSQERAGLTEAIAAGQRLQNLQRERLFELEQLETFVHSKVIWIRDGEPLGAGTLVKAGEEMRRLGGWLRGLGSDDVVAGVRRKLSEPRILAALGVLALLPGLAYALFRKWLSRLREAEPVERGRGRRVLAAAGSLTASILGRALAPFYLFFAAWLVPFADLPSEVDEVLGGLLLALGLVTTAWIVNDALIGPEGMLRRRTEVVRAAHAGVRALLWLYALLGLPLTILDGPPFEFESSTRLLRAASYLLGGGLLFVLLRLSPTLARLLRGPSSDGFARRWAPIWNLALLVVLGSLPVLYGAGYGFGAGYLARGVLLTAATVLVLPPAYRATKRLLTRFGEARRRSPASVAPGEKLSPSSHVLQLVGLLKPLFVLGGLLLVGSYWGLNVRAWRVLEQVLLYDLGVTILPTGDELHEFVSVADGLVALAVLLATVWLLRHLPGIYDLAVFPRFDLDVGLRYAIVTISRYGLFFVGLLITLSAIHLDLGRVGWLVAAMGVGLGFGLQEIVSNFVSGIILLVERPIRVGDLVTVGSITGKVQRINIRATTLLNFDRQEVVVPNRSLIASEVTNWTLVDEVTRLVIPIGVAYGSDVDEVRALLQTIIDRQPEVLREPPPQVFFLSHGESSLDFEVRAFLPDPSLRMVLLDRVNTEINREFAARDIEIPFPQRDLHLRSGALLPAPPVQRDGVERTPETPPALAQGPRIG